MTERRGSELVAVSVREKLIPDTPVVQAPKIRYRNYCATFSASIIIGISGIMIGFCLSQTSPISHATWIARWSITFSPALCQILMLGIPAVAAIIGASFTKLTLSRISRKMSLVIGSIIVIISSLIMVIPYQEALLIGRIFQGIGIGFQLGIAGIYLREICPKQLRTYMMPIISIGITLGSLILYLIAYLMHAANYNLSNQAWILISFNGVFAVIQIIGCFTIVPDSPFEKLTKGEFQAAKSIVKTIYLDEYVQEALEEMKVQKQSADRMQEAALVSTTSRSVEDLQLMKKMNRARGVAIFICCYRQLNGGVPLLTFVGPLIGAIETDINGKNGSQQLANITPLICTLVAFVGNIVGVIVLARILGRKTLLIMTASIMIVTNIGSAIVLQLQLQWAFFALSIIQMATYGLLSLAPGWTYPNEVVSPDRVALQNSLTALSLAVAVFLNPIIYNVMPENNGFPLFYFYGAWNIVGLFLFSIVMVQSKGRTFKEIIALY